MRNPCHHLEATLRMALALVLLSGMGWGQGLQAGPEPARSEDVFALWHVSLSAAADRTLAAALADKPWMKTPEAPAGTADRPTTIPLDPVARVRAALQRVQQLRPIIEPILRQEGVPTELSAIVLVESGGQPTALSPKGARGLWQFMPDTARRYGLTVTSATDERLDATKSTRAAARYLRDLHQQFGDWQLVFAAYNAGEQAVAAAMARSGQRGFPAVQRGLPLETRNYVPAVLNAMAILGSSLEGSSRAADSNRSPTRRLRYATAERTE